MADDAAQRARFLLHSGGYSPIPVIGKVPALQAWQKHVETNATEIALWRKLYPDAVNTGILCRLNPTVDADLLNEEAAEAVEGLFREYFEERGFFLVRMGRAPKRAFLLRTDVPFPKMTRNVVAPNGATEKIEVLCDGQQVVVFGVHPETKCPYLWFGGEPGTIRCEDLPYTRADELVPLLDRAVALLVRDHGYTAAAERPKPTNGAGSHGPEDWGYLIGNILAGKELHDDAASLALKLVTAGISGGAAVNLLRALHDLSSAPHDQRFEARYADIPRAVDSAQRKSNVIPLRPDGGLDCVAAFPIDGSKLPRRPWLVPGLLLRRQVTLFVAPPGIGKSLLTLQVAMMCARGTAWARWKPRGRFQTLVINVEEDATEMRRRLHGARLVMEYEDNLDGILLAKTDNIVVAKADTKTKTVTATPMLEEIVQTIIARQIDIVVVDPFAETFAGDENSNSELKWCAVLWREVARRTNCAVLLVHHAKKYAQNMAGDMDAARGGGSLAGVARIVSTLFTVAQEEYDAHEPQLQKEFPGQADRSRFIRYDDAKATFSAMSPNACWFHKRSIGIGNSGESEPEDEVGVLVPWVPPDAFANLPCDKANAILDEIAIGLRADDGRPTGDPYAPHRKGGSQRWVGLLIQRELGCSASDAKKIGDTWLSKGVLIEYQAPVSNSRRTNRACVKVDNSKRPGATISEVRL